MVNEVLPLGNGKPKVKPQVKVIGVGGAGCNTIADSPYEGLAICAAVENARRPNSRERIVIPARQLELIMTSSARTVISLAPSWIKKLREETAETDLIYVFSGLGGDLGSNLTPLVARMCKRPDNLVVSSVALPFSVEGRDRKEVARAALQRTMEESDLTITYPNDQLMRIAPNLPLGQAFSVMDSIMTVPPRELEKVLTRDDLGLIKKDLSSCSFLRFGYGQAEGPRRERMAVYEAFSSPWFDFDLSKVRGGIAVIYAKDLDDVALKEVTSRITAKLPLARLRLAARADPAMGERLRVMLLLGGV